MDERLYRKIIWDYDIPKAELEKLLDKRIDAYMGLTREVILPRCLQRLSWFELMDLFGLEELKLILESQVHMRLRDPLQRVKYEQGAYYREKLYPFQDGILKIVNDLRLPFYLTGGTALSRFYLQTMAGHLLP